MARHASTSWSAPDGAERCGSPSLFLPLNFTTCLREAGHDGPCHHEVLDPDDFPEQPRCGAPLDVPSMWPGVIDGCCREHGHGGPHHYRLEGA